MGGGVITSGACRNIDSIVHPKICSCHTLSHPYQTPSSYSLPCTREYMCMHALAHTFFAVLLHACTHCPQPCSRLIVCRNPHPSRLSCVGRPPRLATNSDSTTAKYAERLIVCLLRSFGLENCAFAEHFWLENANYSLNSRGRGRAGGVCFRRCG